MEIRLIAADMDGTLLDDEKGIPEENLRAFRACASQGIEIVPATGRTMRGLPDELRNLPGVHYAILTNGAQVVDLAKNEIIDSCRIPVALAEKIMMMARTSSAALGKALAGISNTSPRGSGWRSSRMTVRPPTSRSSSSQNWWRIFLTQKS